MHFTSGVHFVFQDDVSHPRCVKSCVEIMVPPFNHSSLQNHSVFFIIEMFRFIYQLRIIVGAIQATVSLTNRKSKTYN